MTIPKTGHKIDLALRDGHLSKRELTGILTSTAPKLSNGEAKLVAELHNRVTSSFGAAEVTAEPATLDKLNAFIGKKQIPVGDTAAPMRNAINELMMRVRLAPPRDTLPRGIDKLLPLPLSEGPQPLGGPQRMAYVDVAKKRFYLVETQPTLQNNTAVWGPLGLPAVALPVQNNDVITPQRAALLLTTWTQLQDRGLINYTPGAVADSLPGTRFAEVQLLKEAHPDGYTFTAFIPVGPNTPTAPQQNPEGVNEFYIQRSGGFAGMTRYFGPVTL